MCMTRYRQLPFGQASLLLFLQGLLVALALVLVFRTLVLLVFLALLCCRPEKNQWFKYNMMIMMLLWPNWNIWQIKWWQSPVELLFLHAFGLLLSSGVSLSSPVFLAFCRLLPLCSFGTSCSIFPASGSFFTNFSCKKLLVCFLISPSTDTVDMCTIITTAVDEHDWILPSLYLYRNLSFFFSLLRKTWNLKSNSLTYRSVLINTSISKYASLFIKLHLKNL